MVEVEPVTRAVAPAPEGAHDGSPDAGSTGVSWSAVAAVAAAERRAGWRALVLLGVLFGLVAGLVLGTAAVAERTVSAYPRLVDAVGLDDARVQVPTDQPGLVAAVRRLPGAREVWLSYGWVARVEGANLRYASLGAGPAQPPDLVRPVLVAGRAPDPAAADELMISEPFAEQSGLRVGTAVTIRLLTLDQIARFGTGVGEPEGPIVPMVVVGIARMPTWGGALAQALAGPAFALRYAGFAATRPAFVRLSDAPGSAAAFSAAFSAAAAAAPPSIVGGALPPTVELPREEGDLAVAVAERTLLVGLTIFASVLAVGGLLVVGQGLLRHHSAGRTAQIVERALGLTSGERVAARIGAAAPIALLVAVLAGATATTAGLVSPLGSLARFEPRPGFRMPWVPAVGGSLVAALVFLVLVGLTAAAAGPRMRGARAPVRSRGSAWTGFGPAALVGLRLAAQGHGRAVAISAGTAFAVAGIVAALAFGSGIAALQAEPARFGQAADLILADAQESDVAELVADPRVAALSVVRSGTATLVDGGSGSPLAVQAVTQRKDVVPAGLADGRLPGPGEIALTPRLAVRRGLNVGDVVLLTARDGAPTPLRVSGTVVTVDDNGHLGDGALVDDAALDRLTRVGVVRAEIVSAPGQTRPLGDELGRHLEVVPRQTPSEVRSLADLGELPQVLAAALAVVAGAAMTHTLVTAARRHRRELGVLTAVGATPGQIRATLSVLGLAIAAPALVLGVPLGLAVARLLWWQVATSIGVAGDLVAPVGLLAVAVPLTLVLALGLALAPGLRATRDSAAARLES